MAFKHNHFFNDEAVLALKKVAIELGLQYSEVKRRFVFLQDLDITYLFWNQFLLDNPSFLRPKIDYCHTCKKFMVTEMD